MKKIDVGKITSFHGVKGEIRIQSSFPYKEKAFQVGTNLIIDGKTYKIVSYRRHKIYEMVRLEGLNTLDDVLFLRGKKVEKEESDLHLEKNEILDEELLTYQVLTNEGKKGTIEEIFFASENNKIIRIEVEQKEYLIPYRKPFIEEINQEKKQVKITWIAW